MKKIIFSVIALLSTFFLVACSVREKKHISISYEDVNVRSENENYWGYINLDEIIIINKKNKEEKRISLPFISDQFAFSLKNIYVLERGDNIVSQYAKIYKYNFEGDCVDSWQIDGVNHFYYKENKLFFQYWLNDEQVYPQILQNGMIVDAYVSEEYFGKKIIRLKANKEGICEIDSSIFYLHSEGYFSTEKEYSGYPGVSSRIWSSTPGVMSAQEEKNQKLLKKELGYDENYKYETHEYQNKESVFGVLLVWKREKKFKQSNTIPLNNIVNSYTYRINMQEEKLTILGRYDNLGVVATTDKFFVYLKEGKCIKRIYKTGMEDILFELGDEDYYLLALQDNYLRIGEKNPEFVKLY